MPPLDWIHIAAFVSGLALQFFTNHLGATHTAPQPTPAPSPAFGPEAHSKPLLDLVHKLLDQRQATSPPSDSQTLQALMAMLNKLLDQPTPATKA